MGAALMLARRHRNSGRQHDGKRFPGHLQFVRGFRCLIEGKADHVCSGKVQAMHVDYAGGKGMGLKVADYYTVPGCAEAHCEQTDVLGWRGFEAKYGIDALALAKELASKSPHIIRAAREAGYLQEEVEE
jgi:hypothetical protein